MPTNIFDYFIIQYTIINLTRIYDMRTKLYLLMTCIALLSQSLFCQGKGEIIYTKFDSDYIIANSCVPVEGEHVGYCDSLDINYDGIWDLRVY